MLVFWGWTVCWAGETTGYQVSNLTFGKTDQSFTIKVKGDGVPTFTTYQLFDPLRLVVDIANASFVDGLKLPMAVNQDPVVNITGKVLVDKKPFIAKLEIMLSEDWPYKIERQANDIVIKLSKVVDNKANETTADKIALESPGKYNIKSVDVKAVDDGLDILLVAGEPISKFTKVELPKGHGRPDRFYLDIPAVAATGLKPIREVGLGSLARIRMAKRKNGVRVVFDSALDGMFPYEVKTSPEGLLVKVGNVSPKTSSTQAVEGIVTSASKQDAVSSLLAELSSDQDDNAEKPVVQQAEAAVTNDSESSSSALAYDHGRTAKSQLKNVGITGDVFADAGYDKQKITVDFYKIDLHNVFRLIGEISGYNIVIDDAVNGSLTLALSDVPWDFVLDVVMNLKDLQKEERYNTIVISPKSKNFSWPENDKQQALDMEAPSDQLQVSIDEQLSQPPEALAANLIIQRADVLAKAGKLKEALAQYEAAYDKWPQNIGLSKRIANICLVDLGYNQKAVDYAKKALAITPDDEEAALLAAVGLANMQLDSAGKYFEQAVSVERPARAALVSYAGYLENKGDLNKGLDVLGRYETLYGSDLNTMIAKARLYDKLKQPNQAVAEYKAILYSGYDLDQDLARYIKGRIAAGTK
jgi:type IV pilus assembly protein PilQ